MYLPTPFEVTDREAIRALIESAPFATVVTPGPPVQVSHLPLVFEPGSGDEDPGRLRGHVARANPHAGLFDGSRETLAVFHGPHAYVSPRWYADGDAPPTWNYAVVHAWGRPVPVSAPERIAAHLDELAARYEGGELTLSPGKRRALERGIVVFELEIERVEAKFKLGQNRTAADRAGTVAALERGSEVERELASWTRRLTTTR